MILTHGANSLESGGGDFVEIGGRKYPVVKIGNQLWMAENLDYKFDVNGSTLPIGPSGTPNTPAAWYYNNDEASYGVDGTYKCGLLYNWYATKYLDDNKTMLLPSGWHVPSKTEWEELLDAVGGVSTAGTKLKSINNFITLNWPSNWNGTDDYGFGILPAGSRYNSFQDIGTDARYWTATENSTQGAWRKWFDSDAPAGSNSNYKYQGVSLRLVKSLE